MGGRGGEARGERLSKVLQIALGILAAIGGFVDMGDIVFSATAGATFGYQLIWAVILGAIGIMLYSEMCGRVVTVANRPVFDVVRERLGYKVGLTTLFASQFVNLMTCAAEVGGLAFVLRYLFGLPYRPLIAVAGGAWVLSLAGQPSPEPTMPAVIQPSEEPVDAPVEQEPAPADQGGDDTDNSGPGSGGGGNGGGGNGNSGPGNNNGGGNGGGNGNSGPGNNNGNG